MALDKERKLSCMMLETNGGGSAEMVPGFDVRRALTAGFQTKRIAGPTLLAARPDGGFFSDSEPSGDALVTVVAPKAENVVGIDNRVRVTETAAVPWRCICQLEIEYDRGPVGFGTGFFVGPKTVITAAHVLVDISFGATLVRRAKKVRVVPGRNGAMAPYGYVVSTDFDYPDPWKKSEIDHEAAARVDVGAIQLPDDATVDGCRYGERIGYFGLHAREDFSNGDGTFLLVNNAGYPLTPNRPYGTLWYNAGRVHAVEQPFIDYMIDTEGGQSGSPIFFYDEASRERYVVAIHTTGDFVNRGLMITSEIFDLIAGWAGRSD